MKKLASMEGHRWAIEDSFEAAKNELGLDHNETRSWHGWHRHVSLVMLAFAMMAAIRHKANARQAQSVQAARARPTGNHGLEVAILKVGQRARSELEQYLAQMRLLLSTTWRDFSGDT